jgi:hypothetical protein
LLFSGDAKSLPFWIDDGLEFIPIKPLVAMASNARESYATHSRLP